MEYIFNPSEYTLDLHELISFEGFSFAEYARGERVVLRPRLLAKGYKNITFFNIDSDSFGPLVRGVIMTGPDGKQHKASYG